jgi:hypothetical protein
MKTLLYRIPKPVLFGIFGAIGCLVGWAVGEPLLKMLSSAQDKTKGASGGVSQGSPNLIFSNPVMEQVTRERGAHKGEIEIGLLWKNTNDLDLHCIDPLGEEISYRHKQSRSGGALDVDCNVSAPFRVPGAEHIYWKEGNAPDGNYKVYVHHYRMHEGFGGTTPFEVEILAQGRSYRLVGALRDGEESAAQVFTISGNSSRNEGAGQGSVAPSASFSWKGLGLVGLWSALLAVPLAAALVVGQNAFQHRALFQTKERNVILGGGLVGGFVSGIVSQFLFSVLAQKSGLASNAFLLGLGQAIGWGVLGGLLGGAMTLFIPNLPPKFAVPGGMVGGLVGGIVFILASKFVGEFLARGIGAASVGFGIGAMIAIAEKLSREAALIVHWGPNERSIINLGSKPVVLGSSLEADLYLPKEKGFPPVTALVTFLEGKVSFENKINQTRSELRNGSRLQLGDLAVEVTAR